MLETTDSAGGDVLLGVFGISSGASVTGEGGGGGGEGLGTETGDFGDAIPIGDVSSGASLYICASLLRSFAGLAAVSLDSGLDGFCMRSPKASFGIIVSLFERRRQRDTLTGEIG